MNIRLLLEIQAVIFRIISILFGLYLILVLIKEIVLLFSPPKHVEPKPIDTSINKDINSEHIKFIVEERHQLVKPIEKMHSPKKKKIKRTKSRRSKK